MAQMSNAVGQTRGPIRSPKQSGRAPPGERLCCSFLQTTSTHQRPPRSGIRGIVAAFGGLICQLVIRMANNFSGLKIHPLPAHYMAGLALFVRCGCSWKLAPFCAFNEHQIGTSRIGRISLVSYTPWLALVRASP
ncbi:hypothetical protein M011DRAFT_241619 [Sporormia fimetaria CBS 119925]|uniref:Uncharacterized protein n=1 Tax=Sporormia fimetaria CBS 119925 TaxID=1340428 RepID=A0A6A6VIE4_9PLEO|nr:hypothetical protein M011DRAFT_241619 [Sporormia fimetaria CBS 119925]